MVRMVAWCNLWNWAAANHGDYGSLTHLTKDGVSGKTLCGREYPASKGHPAPGRICKRCRKIAGLTSLEGIVWAPSVEEI